MKKIYSIFLALVAMMVCTVAADAAKVTLKVDNPDNVSVNYQAYIDGSPKTVDVELTGETTEFECPAYGSVNITPKDGLLLVSCLVNGVESVNSMTYGINIYNDTEISVKTGKLADLQTGSFTVTVDDPSKIKLSLAKSGELKALVSGENTVKFIPKLDDALYISTVGYSTEIFKVTKNGEKVEPYYGSNYNIVPAEGMNLNIQVNYPDENETVTFKYSEGAEGCITKVEVNRNQPGSYEVTDFSNGFSVKCGSKVYIKGNNNDYNFKSFKVNGSVVSFYGDIELSVKENTEIEIEAEKYAMIQAHIVVDDARNVKVYKGYASYNDVLDVVDGDNLIEINSRNPMITITASEIGEIKTVKAGDNELKADYSGNYQLNLEDGMTVAITSEKAKTLTFTAYCSQEGCYVRTGKSYAQIMLIPGYNHVELKEKEYPVNLSAPYNSEYMNGYFYFDDVLQGDGAQSYVYYTPESDQSVVKIYVAKISDPESSKPALHALSFEVADEVASAITVKSDKVKTVDHTAGLNALAGTLVEITHTPAAREAAAPLVVKVGDKDVTMDENGVYAFTVDGDAKVSVKKNTESAVAGIEAEGLSAPVYNMQGIRVLENSDDFSTLPAGIYIVNGKKVVK